MIYGIIYTILAFLSLYNNKIKNYHQIYILVFFSLVLVFGFRHETGGDWFSNLNDYNSVTDFETFIKLNYNFSINFLVLATKYLGINFPGFIFIQSLIFFYAIYRFSSVYKNSYFILCLLFPISVMILGLGFIRQGLAFSCFLFFLTTPKKYNFLFLIVGVFFHFTSIIYFLVYFMKIIFDYICEKKYTHIYLILLTFLVLSFISIERVSFYISHYFQDYYQSTGAVIRSSINFISASLIIILYLKKYIVLDKDYIKYIMFSSIFVVILFPFVFFYSTPIDRIQLYFSFLPAVASYILIEIIKHNKIKFKIHLNILIVFFLFLWIWINYGKFYYNWDYKFLFF